MNILDEIEETLKFRLENQLKGRVLGVVSYLNTDFKCSAELERDSNHTFPPPASHFISEP